MNTKHHPRHTVIKNMSRVIFLTLSIFLMLTIIQSSSASSLPPTESTKLLSQQQTKTYPARQLMQPTDAPTITAVNDDYTVDLL